MSFALSVEEGSGLAGGGMSRSQTLSPGTGVQEPGTSGELGSFPGCCFCKSPPGGAVA